MKQINFRLTEDEYQLVELISKYLQKSVPTLLKELGMKEIKVKGVELALNLYKNNKIGLKKAWKLSQLPFHEFSQLLVENGIEPNIPDDLDQEMIDKPSNIMVVRDIA